MVGIHTADLVYECDSTQGMQQGQVNPAINRRTYRREVATRPKILALSASQSDD